MELVLASASPARLMLLRQAGIEPLVRPTDVDEEGLIAAYEAEHGALTPQGFVLLLAQAKAEAFLGTPEGSSFTGLVFGGDSALEFAGQMLGKPHTPERARERWQAQRGKSAVLHSGHHLIRVEAGVAKDAAQAATATEVTFSADMTDADLEAYIASGEPLNVAGAFTIDARGAAFIDTITGDPSTVVGLSIPAVRRLAAELGVAWPTLWNRD